MTDSEPSHHASAGHSGTGAGTALRWVGALGIATVAVMRCAIFFAPQVVFDVDPAFDPQRLGGLGPAGSLWLDVVLLVVCAGGLLGEALARKGIDWVLLLLAFVPLPVVVWHGIGDAGDLWTGATWASAAIACATVAHLGRDRRLRGVLLMCLLAGIVPVLIRGAANVTYEYEDTIGQFEQRKAAILEEKGWEADSPSALIFERRLRQRQPTGWFLTTNIFGSLAGVGVVAWLGLAIASARSRLESGWTGLFALAALAAAVGLWMSGSKGAILACAGGLVLLLGPRVWGVGRRLMKRWGSAIGVAIVVAALLGVVVRGVMLPEGFHGEKSLLFRWHYMQASAAIVAGHPLAGVGADGYRQAYLKSRVPRNPEEVASAHSMFWDWLCGLGVSGAAWTAMGVMLVWRAGRSLSGDGESQAEDAGVGVRAALWSTLCVLVPGLVPALVCEAHTLDILGVCVRILGMIGFLAAALVIGRVITLANGAMVNAGLAAAAIAAVVHGQIEMTFTMPGPAVWAMCVLGLAGGACGRQMVWPGGAAAVIGFAAAAWMAVSGAAPATRMEGRMVEAARELWPIAEARRDLDTVLRERRPAFKAAAAERLDETLRRMGADDRMLAWMQTGDAPSQAMVGEIARLMRDSERQRRPAAADMLAEAHAAMPTAKPPLIAAARQLELAQRLASGEQRIDLLKRALEHLKYWVQRGDRSSAAAPACQVNLLLAQLTGEKAFEHEAITLAQRITLADPNGLSGWRMLGDVLWESGHRIEALAAYERALEINANFELDPLKQLPKKDMAEIAGRIAEARSGEGS